MQPRVDIQKVRERYYNYSVSTRTGVESYARQGLRSVAECLHDAATALGMNFSHASISFDGVLVGSWPVAAMEHKTASVVADIGKKLAGTCREGTGA